MRVICNYTNGRKDREIQAHTDADDISKHARIQAWKPVTMPEVYSYLGIRIYIGLHAENDIRFFWKVGLSLWLTHPVSEVISLRWYKAIYTAFQLCTDDPEHEFKAVFDRVSLILNAPDLFLIDI